MFVSKKANAKPCAPNAKLCRPNAKPCVPNTSQWNILREGLIALGLALYIFMLFVQLFPDGVHENYPTQRLFLVEYRLKVTQQAA